MSVLSFITIKWQEKKLSMIKIFKFFVSGNLNIFNMLNIEKIACSDLPKFCTYQSCDITMLLLNPIEFDFAILFRMAMEN